MRILVAEDNAANQEVLREILQLRGHEVTIVDDGCEVLQRLETVRPDLLLLDIQMPGASGFEVIAQVRGNESLARLPVIAVTAYAMLHDHERTRAAGFDGHVSKPIESRVLFAEIERVCGLVKQNEIRRMAPHPERRSAGRPQTSELS